MFDRIAPRYDLLNRALSFGLDVGWRKRVVAELPAGRGLRVLDVATGTADLAIALARSPRVESVVGVDIAERMLAEGRQKVRAAGLEASIRLVYGDAADLHAHREFDAATIAFGIRNVPDPVAVMRQMREAVRPAGRVLVLELSEPRSPVLGPIYRAYRRNVVPRIGGLVSGDSAAYAYLDETIATFPAGEAFLALMREAGLTAVTAAPLALGAVTLYAGFAPEG